MPKYMQCFIEIVKAAFQAEVKSFSYITSPPNQDV